MYEDCNGEHLESPMTIGRYVSEFVKTNLIPYLQQNEDVVEIIRKKVE